MVAAQRMSDAIAWYHRTRNPTAPGGKNPGSSCSCPGPCEHGGNKIRAYVDDYIPIFPRSLSEFLWEQLLTLVSELGLPTSSTPGHLVPPTQVFTGLGWMFNLVENTVAVPADKVDKALLLVDLWTHKYEATA